MFSSYANTHLLRHNMNRNIPQGVWVLRTAWLHISSVLKWSVTNAKERGSICTTSLHISWVHGIYFSMRNKIYRNVFLNKSLILLTSLGRVRSKYTLRWSQLTYLHKEGRSLVPRQQTQKIILIIFITRIFKFIANIQVVHRMRSN